MKKAVCMVLTVGCLVLASDGPLAFGGGKGNPDCGTQLTDKALEANNGRRLKTDFLQALQLRKLDPEKTVSLVVGHPQKKLEPAQEALLVQTVSQVKEQGHTIVYDADSSAAPLISKLAGSQGIGISGSLEKKDANPDHKVVAIENTSLRMDAFLFRYNDAYQKGHRLVVGLDSSAGVGLLLQNHPKAFVLDSSHLWHDQLQKWVKSLGQKGKDLALVEPPPFLRIGKSEDLSQMGLNQSEKDAILQNIVLDETKIENMSAADKEIAARYSDEILTGEEKGIARLGGAVIFCSAVGDPVTNGVLAQIASHLGEAHEPVVTGGSIATMQIVNQAAKDAGGVSVGLPIRRPEGHPEFVVPTQAHTVTHMVEAHPARLHFLLEGRDAIIIGPGGKGIIKEIGATLIKFAAQTNLEKLPHVVLVDRYYEGLYDFILSLPIPEEIRSRFKLLPIDKVNKETILQFLKP